MNLYNFWKILQYWTMSMVRAHQTSSRLPSAHINPQNINDLLSPYFHFMQYLALLHAPTGSLTKNRYRHSISILTSSVKTTSATLRNPIVLHLYKTGVALIYASQCDNLHFWLNNQVARSFWYTYLLSGSKFFHITWSHLKLLDHTKTDFHFNLLYTQYFIALKLFLSSGLR